MDANKLIKYMYLLFTMTLCLACNQKKTEEKKESVESFNDVELPIVNGQRLIFILKDKIVFQFKLKDVYDLYFKPNNQDYDRDVFLNEYVYNNKLSIQELKENSYFESKVNEEFFKKYKHIDIDILKDKFCINNGYRTYIKNDLDYDTQVTLCYIFFINDYDIGYDDVEGIFVINNV